MKKQLLNSLFLVVIGSLMLAMAQDVVANHEIIGAPKCKGCHKAKTGDQWKIWTESAHARAFNTLASEEARKIASDQGLDDPQAEEACLKCHATRASLGAGAVVSGKANYTDSEGIGCESCHGPGSNYKPRKIMIDPQAAALAGLVMDSSAGACIQCHNEESPTFKGFDFEKRWAEINHPVPAKEQAQAASSSALANVPDEFTFSSSVGNVLFPHNLHFEELELECSECHHQIHAMGLDTPHPGYMTSSWINCQICHDTKPENEKDYYKCSDCHHSDPDNIADETLSSKVVMHKSCWKCHESGTGVQASKGCIDCHVKEEK
jgi:hypothetical protein